MFQLLPPTKEEVNAFARVCLERPHISPSRSEASVRKSPSDISRQSFIVVEFRIFVCLLARLARIWMTCCVSTYVGTWTNWLTFEPDPEYSADAGTGLLSPLSYMRCYAEFFVGENPTYTHIIYMYTYLPLQRSVVLQWFYSLSHLNTFVWGTCAPPNALLVSNTLNRYEWLIS